MSKLRVNAFSMSADGFGAGRDQGRDHMGRGGEQLHQWSFSDPHLPAGRTKARRRHDRRRRRLRGTLFRDLDGIMGRNMFGPVRGPWPDYEWNGWWGANP